MENYKRPGWAVSVVVVASAIFMATLLVPGTQHGREGVAQAQAPQDQGPPSFQGFQPGQGPPGGFPGQGPGMGPGGFPGRMPFVMGTVVEVDAKANVLYVEAPFGGEQTVKVTSATKLVTQATAKVADIKVGDRLQIQGMPTGIAASGVTIGEMPEGLRMGPRPGGSQRSATPGRPAMPQMPQAMAMATGTVKALNPLTIAVNENVRVTVRVASDARLTKFIPTTLASIKEDDRVMVAGSQGDDGTFNATAIAVNAGMFGMPGFGGPPGMVRPGGGGNPGAPSGQPPVRR